MESAKARNPLTLDLSTIEVKDYFDKDGKKELPASASTPETPSPNFEPSGMKLRDFKKQPLFIPQKIVVGEPETKTPDPLPVEPLQVDIPSPSKARIEDVATELPSLPPSLVRHKTDFLQEIGQQTDEKKTEENLHPLLAALVATPKSIPVPSTVEVVIAVPEQQLSQTELNESEKAIEQEKEKSPVAKAAPVEDKEALQATPPPAEPSLQQQQQIASTSPLEVKSNLADMILAPAIKQPAQSGFQPEKKVKKGLCTKVWEFITCAKCCEKTEKKENRM